MTKIVQIIRTAPSDGSPDGSVPSSVEKISKATDKNELITEKNLDICLHSFWKVMDNTK